MPLRPSSETSRKLCHGPLPLPWPLPGPCIRRSGLLPQVVLPTRFLGTAVVGKAGTSAGRKLAALHLAPEVLFLACGH